MSDQLDSVLKSVLLQGPPLRLAILFGSAARNQLRPSSDIDIGIVPRDRDLPLAIELQLQASLARACARDVDLVRLDRATTLLRWRVAKDGHTLVADPDYERVRFLAWAAIDYGDFAPALMRAADRFRRRLADPNSDAGQKAHTEPSS